MGSRKTYVACTFDIWTGRIKVGYIALTAHYLDVDWNIQKRLIGFRKIPYPHTAENIFVSIMDIFEFYGIKEKVISITFDNASNNTATIPMFRSRLNPPNGFELFHQRCVCHIINLIVQDGTQELKNYVDNIRSALSYITSTGRRQEEFDYLCDSYSLPHKKFILDVPHRWNSLYLMLTNCIDYKQPII
jgi:hypothetical protein